MRKPSKDDVERQVKEIVASGVLRSQADERGALGLLRLLVTVYYEHEDSKGAKGVGAVAHENTFKGELIAMRMSDGSPAGVKRALGRLKETKGRLSHALNRF